MSTGLMHGKRGLIMGLANDKSIAWGIAQALAAQGAELAFSYQGEALKKRVEPLAESLGVPRLFECDVASDDSIDALFTGLQAEWGQHRLSGPCHRLCRQERVARPLCRHQPRRVRAGDGHLGLFLHRCLPACRGDDGAGGSLLTLTYYGAEKVMPHYNVMGVAKAGLEASVKYLAEDLGKDGIRVNAISAGPIKTLAASGIGDFRYIMRWNELNSPLRRNVTQEEVGKAALYLLSDLGSGTTGENLHVDCGYHVVGMKAIDAPDIDVVTGKKDGGQ
jgi:enoyl-[acyl-carrier protein] reductase I